MNLPTSVNEAIDLLEKSGFQAYAVGGCVRDVILGEVPKDWDLCTSALPAQTLQVFSGYKTIPTGLQHGTVTVVIDHMPLEITTFRIDGDYKDNRHPEEVIFTASIEEDLARRDFTINAMAYSPSRGLVDVYGGRSDIKAGLIRTVGRPAERFQEDGLRIMRGLRFASVLGFKIEEETSEAMHKARRLLENIARERINVELCKFIVGTDAAALMDEYRDILAVFMPQIEDCFGFQQRNPHHIYDVWEHTVKAVGASKKDEIVRLALLLHDLGKPTCFSLDENGIGHFYSHGKVSEEIGREILNELRFDNDRKSKILTLVSYHDADIVCQRRSVKRLLGKLGEELFYKLLEVKRGDCSAQAPVNIEERLAEIDKAGVIARELIDEAQCFQLKDLAVNGCDIIEAGIATGPEIGRLLNLGLDAVIDEKISNEKDEIMDYFHKLKDE